jgi:hypothetical protein
VVLEVPLEVGDREDSDGADPRVARRRSTMRAADATRSSARHARTTSAGRSARTTRVVSESIGWPVSSPSSRASIEAGAERERGDDPGHADEEGDRDGGTADAAAALRGESGAERERIEA